uniref:Uncharacterized protein n=1 Tax=Panagrolaimus davidi TaxID=227884 RepID=A0A914NX62_9BILA
MPKLIREILREIFINLLGNHEENAEHIERFMLSGKREFEAAINFLSTAIRVTIVKDDFLVLFPTGPHLIMSYNCVLLKTILNAIANSIDQLEFRKKPVAAVENIVFETLIVEGLKSILFYPGHEVPPK